MSETPNKWYIKKEGQITGPFTKQIITNHLKLGRLSSSDELSTDRINWTVIQLAEQLFGNDNFKNGALSLDERDGFDRRQNQSAEETELVSSRRKRERRAPENYKQILRRQLRTELLKKYRESSNYSKRPIALLIMAVAIVTLLAIIYPTRLPSPSSNCETDATVFVDWSNCNKTYIDLSGHNLTGAELSNSQLFSAKLMNINLEKANLAYADLRLSDLSYSHLVSAKFIGSNLQNVDLSYANLTGADLSFANLAGANIGGAELQGAILANTIWVNGKTCSADSIAECVFD